MPRIPLAGRLALFPGQIVSDGSTRLALAAAVAAPRPFPATIRKIEARDGQVTVVLARGGELRLGERSALALKLAVAARVLRSLTADERSTLGYLDLTVPDRPVAGDKPQVST